jgi:hypothetical protein
MLTLFKAFAAALDELRRHATFFLLLVAMAALALLGRSWLDARDARIHLEATLAAEQKTIAAATQDQSSRDVQLAQSLAQITAAKQKVQTAQQAAAALEQAIPQLLVQQGNAQPLPSPMTIELPTQRTRQSESSARSPSAQAAAIGAGNQPPTSSSTVAPHASAQLEPRESGAPEASPSPSTATPPATAASAAATASGSPASSMRKALSHLKSEISNLKLPSDPRPSSGSQSSNGAHPSTGSQQSSAARSSQTSAQPSANTSSSSGAAPAIPTPSNATGSAAPPAIFSIPQDDLKPLYDAIEDCEACNAKLAAAQGDLQDETTKFNAASAERDAAIKSARGTFWTHARSAAKWFAVGAAAGAILARYH